MTSRAGPEGPDSRWAGRWPPDRDRPDDGWSGNGHGSDDPWAGSGDGSDGAWPPEPDGAGEGTWSPERDGGDDAGWSGSGNGSGGAWSPERDGGDDAAWSGSGNGSGSAWSPDGGQGSNGSPSDDRSEWGDRAPVPEPAPASDPHRQIFVPAPDPANDPPIPWLDDGPAVDDPAAFGGPPPAFVPPAEPPPGLRPRLPPRTAAPPWSGDPRHGPRRRPPTIDRHRLSVVYDVDGPRVRLGVAWFVGALLATIISPFTAAVVYAVAAGMAARQIARAWGSVSWQADMAAGLGALPVLAALGGTKLVFVAFGLAAAVGAGAACARDGARMRGPGGRLAATGILWLSLTPAVGAAAFVLVRSASVVSAVVLLMLASAYEAGDYIVGSGAGNPVEGPLAGITTASLIGLPLALLLVAPFDDGGAGLLVFAAAAYPFGQIVASAVLPGAGAPAPALRRIDTLLLLAPLWAVAAGVH